MTQVLDRSGPGPMVHALVIGVGSYRHLPGGEDEVDHDTLGLKQLSGPPASAEAVATWLATSLRHPRATLGSIELLTSPAITVTLDGTATEVELPTLDNVKDAFDRWFDRCDASADNVALLYMCGHGVQRESDYLLLEDFGASEGRMLENAVDVRLTYKGMADCSAREQYVVVDACRDIPHQLAQLLTGNAAVLRDPRLAGDPRTHSALMFATSGGFKAYGKPNVPTRYTAALLEALAGPGAQNRGTRWEVDFSGLSRGIRWLLEHQQDAPLQIPELAGKDGVLHVLDQTPHVEAIIRCDPDPATPTATVQLQPVAVAGQPLVPQLTDDTWHVRAPADIYQLELTFPDGSYTDTRTDKRLWLLPPGFDQPIPVDGP